MKTVFAVDTSTDVISVALLRDELVLGELSVHAPRKHAERLIEMCDMLLKETNCSLSDVDLFAVSTGPGSFTGLRIGVATWKGFALAENKPLIGISTLQVLASGSGLSKGRVCSLIDAKMKEIYGAIYIFNKGVLTESREESVAPLKEYLKKIGMADLYCGDGAILYRDAILESDPDACFGAASVMYPRASVTASLALERFKNGDTGDSGHVNPVYLRQSQAEENRKKKLLEESAS